jgi:hypothetical protein
MGEQTSYYARVAGVDYLDTLGRLHELLNPRTYLEIGTQTGMSLQKAGCASVAIDPQFKLRADIMVGKSSCLLYQMTSDEFFAKFDPIKLLGCPLDLAFLDGMHLYEYLLRDFYNVEKYCTEESIIVLHDCLPPEHAIAVRNMDDPVRKTALHPDWWAGDVWKIIPILRKYRPSLKITLTDPQPTGLVFITGLSPKNRTLVREYDRIVNDYCDVDERRALDEFWSTVNITPIDSFLSSIRDRAFDRRRSTVAPKSFGWWRR